MVNNLFLPLLVWTAPAFPSPSQHASLSSWAWSCSRGERHKESASTITSWALHSSSCLLRQDTASSTLGTVLLSGTYYSFQGAEKRMPPADLQPAFCSSAKSSKWVLLLTEIPIPHLNLYQKDAQRIQMATRHLHKCTNPPIQRTHQNALLEQQQRISFSSSDVRGLITCKGVERDKR